MIHVRCIGNAGVKHENAKIKTGGSCSYAIDFVGFHFDGIEFVIAVKGVSRTVIIGEIISLVSGVAVIFGVGQVSRCHGVVAYAHLGHEFRHVQGVRAFGAVGAVHDDEVGACFRGGEADGVRRGVKAGAGVVHDAAFGIGHHNHQIDIFGHAAQGDVDDVIGFKGDGISHVVAPGSIAAAGQFDGVAAAGGGAVGDFVGQSGDFGAGAGNRDIGFHIQGVSSVAAVKAVHHKEIGAVRRGGKQNVVGVTGHAGAGVVKDAAIDVRNHNHQGFVGGQVDFDHLVGGHGHPVDVIIADAVAVAACQGDAVAAVGGGGVGGGVGQGGDFGAFAGLGGKGVNGNGKVAVGDGFLHGVNHNVVGAVRRGLEHQILGQTFAIAVCARKAGGVGTDVIAGCIHHVYKGIEIGRNLGGCGDGSHVDGDFLVRCKGNTEHLVVAGHGFAHAGSGDVLVVGGIQFVIAGPGQAVDAHGFVGDAGFDGVFHKVQSVGAIGVGGVFAVGGIAAVHGHEIGAGGFGLKGHGLAFGITTAVRSAKALHPVGAGIADDYGGVVIRGCGGIHGDFDFQHITHGQIDCIHVIQTVHGPGRGLCATVCRIDEHGEVVTGIGGVAAVGVHAVGVEGHGVVGAAGGFFNPAHHNL